MKNTDNIAFYSGKQMLPCYDGKMSIFCAMVLSLWHIKKHHMELIKKKNHNFELLKLIQSFNID